MTNDDLTDYVSDIRNHISPTTIVIDLDAEGELRGANLSSSEIPNSSNQIINLDSMTSDQRKAVSRVCAEMIEESLKGSGLFSERPID